MKLYIVTQIEENYGAHDWNREGQCPQRWKMKGGGDYMVKIDSSEGLKELVESYRPKIEQDNDFYREYIIDWEVVHDDYLTPFEKSQLEYEGEIIYKAVELN